MKQTGFLQACLFSGFDASRCGVAALVQLQQLGYFELIDDLGQSSSSSLTTSAGSPAMKSRHVGCIHVVLQRRYLPEVSTMDGTTERQGFTHLSFRVFQERGRQGSMADVVNWVLI